MLYGPANLFGLLVKAGAVMNDFPFEFKVFIKILHNNSQVNIGERQDAQINYR